MIPVSVPDLRGRESELLADCVATNWISSAGGKITEFEARIADFAKVTHAIATCNGTCALEIAARAAGVGAGDKVLIPDWTFAATANALIHAGAEPVFFDVDPDSWCASAETARAALEAADAPIRAIVVVHALGHPADMTGLRALAAERGVALIEDAAGALGSRIGEGHAGTLSDVGILSFNGNKILTTGGGGMVLTNDDEIAARARAFGAQGRVGDRYFHDIVAVNYRMTNLNAAVGLAQLERLDEMMARRRETFRAYEAAVAGLSAYAFAPRLDWAETNCWMSAVRCADRAAAQDLIAACRDAGIGAGLFWEKLSEQPAYETFGAVPTPTADRLSGAVVSLPCSSGLPPEDRDKVIAVLRAMADRLPPISSDI